MRHLLLDAIQKEFGLKNDSAIAAFVGDTRQLISNVRRKKSGVPPSLIIKIHETTKWPVAVIKTMIAADQ
jgi:hypothetical protein